MTAFEDCTSIPFKFRILKSNEYRETIEYYIN